MADLVRERQLRHLRRHPRVVVDEGDDAGVERAAGALVHALAGRFGVRLVLLADSTGCTRC